MCPGWVAPVPPGDIDNQVKNQKTASVRTGIERRSEFHVIPPSFAIPPIKGRSRRCWLAFEFNLNNEIDGKVAHQTAVFVGAQAEKSSGWRRRTGSGSANFSGIPDVS